MKETIFLRITLALTFNYPLNTNFSLFTISYIIDYLSTKNIHTSVHFKPLYLYEPLAQNRQYPVCDSEWPKLITLPCHNRMDETDIDYVIYWIKEYFKCYLWGLKFIKNKKNG